MHGIVAKWGHENHPWLPLFYSVKSILQSLFLMQRNYLELFPSHDTGGTTIASGIKNYPSTSTYAIGNGGKSKKYRVSSGQGDLPASSSARWLKVRTVVTGTNGKNTILVTLHQFRR